MQMMSEQTPEKLELEKKQSELDNLTLLLAQKELDLATLISELLVFESKYVQVVGVRIAELDDIEAQILGKLVSKHPLDPGISEEAEIAREKARASKFASSHIDNDTDHLEEFKPSENIKNLYREVAKQIHPDLAQDEKEKKIREELMKKANQAFKVGDEEKLRSILKEWDSSPDRISGEGIAADLIRIIRQISKIERRI